MIEYVRRMFHRSHRRTQPVVMYDETTFTKEKVLQRQVTSTPMFYEFCPNNRVIYELVREDREHYYLESVANGKQIKIRKTALGELFKPVPTEKISEMIRF